MTSTLEAVPRVALVTGARQPLRPAISGPDILTSAQA